MRLLDSKIGHLEKTVQELRLQHADSQHKADNLVQILHVYEQRHQCEAMYAEGRIIEAAVSLLKITNTTSAEVRTNKLLMDSLAGTFRCHTAEEVFNFCQQSLRVDVYQRWKQLETGHQRSRNMTKHLRPILLHCRSVPRPRTLY